MSGAALRMDWRPGAELEPMENRWRGDSVGELAASGEANSSNNSCELHKLAVIGVGCVHSGQEWISGWSIQYVITSIGLVWFEEGEGGGRAWGSRPF